MQFAKNQQEFSNKNTSCIQCGICITVCPMDVLKFGEQVTEMEAKTINDAKHSIGRIIDIHIISFFEF